MRLIYPALAQIFWTFLVIGIAGRIRLGAIRAKQVKMRDVALSNEGWPERVRAAGNNMNNQFETPILFFALIGIAIYVGATGWAMAVFAWGYVASRVAHTIIHINGNHVPNRFKAFGVGLFLLMAMFGGIVLRLMGLL